jgi:hypothetical protein
MKNIWALFKKKNPANLMITGYKVEVKFDDNEDSAINFLEFADRVGYTPEQKLILMATSEYKKGIEVRPFKVGDSGNLKDNMTELEALGIKELLKGVNGVHVNIIPMISPKGSTNVY